MSKTIPVALAKKQELQRQQTVNSVLHALDYLNSCGMQLSIKNLTECTGLSRSVFSKPHIREVIDEFCSSSDEPTAEQKRKKKRNEKQKEIISKYEVRIEKLSVENKNLQHDNELLRGRIFLLMNRLQNENNS